MAELLYNEFEEVVTANFVRNIARHLAYPVESSGKRLVMNDRGELDADGFRPRFKRDTETRIATTFHGTDRVSVVEWLKSEIVVGKDLSLGAVFNRPAIQVLARYYKYEFVFIVDNIDDLPEDIQSEICRLVVIKMRAYARYPGVKFIISTRDNFLEPVMLETYPAAQRLHHMMLPVPPLPFADVLRRRKTVFFDPLKNTGSGEIQIADNIKVRVDYVDKFIEAVFSAFDNIRPTTDLYKLSGHSIRKMLDIVKAAFESPHITPAMVADITSAYSEPSRQWIPIDRAT